MIKPSWGTKQTCPKCGERFYDLGKATPVICIACETKWTPEPILKSKQTHVAPKKVKVKAEVKVEAEAEVKVEAEVEAKVEGEDAAGPEAKPEGKDADSEETKDDAGVLGDVSLDDADTDMAGVVDAKIDKGDPS